MRRAHLSLAAFAAGAQLQVAAAALAATPSPLICEDSIDGLPPFRSADAPCLLGCGSQIAVATGSLLPGSVNLTAIPYCQLDCVRPDASPAQSSAAPSCYSTCKIRNQMSPENIGWCMYWCVIGYASLVAATACVPSIEMLYGASTTLGDGSVEPYYGFTQPAAWVSWYETQTLLSRSSQILPFATPTATAAMTSAAGSTEGPTTPAASLTAPVGTGASSVATAQHAAQGTTTAAHAADTNAGMQRGAEWLIAGLLVQFVLMLI